ncbi:DUF4160 domain-containing protein [Pararobbsia alpina]
MPTQFRTQGYSVMIYSDDHRPPHIHVIGSDGEVVFDLNCPDGPLEVRRRRGKVLITVVRRLINDISPEIRRLCTVWRKMHGYH